MNDVLNSIFLEGTEAALFTVNGEGFLHLFSIRRKVIHFFRIEKHAKKKMPWTSEQRKI